VLHLSKNTGLNIAGVLYVVLHRWRVVGNPRTGRGVPPPAACFFEEFFSKKNIDKSFKIHYNSLANYTYERQHHWREVISNGLGRAV
jgi:hypothetical protein